MRSLWHQQDKAAMGVGTLVMQQADVSALCLLETLLVSLPQTLLLSYIICGTEEGLLSPGEGSHLKKMPVM